MTAPPPGGVISLVGARGSGKSTVGRLLAEALGRSFADADAELERVVGKTIPEVFAQHGEPAFRALEAEVVAALLERENLVLATGGGAVLLEPTRAKLAAAGPVVYLHADAATLHARTAADADADRPPLTDLPPADEAAAVLARRDPLYRQVATLTVDATAPPADVVAAVAGQLP